MDPEKRLQLIKNVTAALLLAAFLCYASPPEVPECPPKVVMDNMGGVVVFNHQQHYDSSGYGVACYDCHHHFAEDEEVIRPCGDCHLKKTPEIPPGACTETCHVDPDDIEGEDYPNRKDALHNQCTGCHQEYDIGPLDDDKDCGVCHFTNNI